VSKTSGALVALAAVFFTLAATDITSSPSTRTIVAQPSQTLYIRNLAPQYISDATIRKDIPAWQQAVNVDFARYWHTTRFKLVFIGTQRAPVGQMSAVFVNKGPVKGALAYHWLGGNAPAITVYAGTGDYFGYSNSVSFTHELFELAADPVTSYVNMGYPTGYYWLEKKSGDLKANYSDAVGWFNEVCDPVEADSYKIAGVEISDFITPAWFNDGVGARYDFMGVTQQPFWIRPGGYAQYLNSFGWQILTNVRKGHESDAGFYKGEPAEKR
jgi:hypothetical protein